MTQTQPTAFLSGTFREGNPFSGRNEKASFALDQVNALYSLSPGLSVVQGLRAEKEVMNGLIFPSPRPTPLNPWKNPRGKGRPEDAATEDAATPIYLPTPSLPLWTAPSSFPPSDTSKAASGTRVYAEKHMLP